MQRILTNNDKWNNSNDLIMKIFIIPDRIDLYQSHLKYHSYARLVIFSQKRNMQKVKRESIIQTLEQNILLHYFLLQFIC